MNDVAMLIRMCYGEDYPEEARRWRFEYFRTAVLPRILRQRGPEFDLWVWVNPDHADEIKSWSPRINTFTVRTPRMALESRHQWSNVVGVPRYPIQVRLDSDDLIGPHYVKVAVAELNEMHAARSLVWLQPYKLDLETGLVYWCAPKRGRGAYSAVRPSAFLALKQPTTKSGYTWVYGIGHTRMHILVNQVSSISEGYCWATCHGFNDSTHVYPGRDRLIGRFEG